jgi:protein-L-isoaspartate(D-aspartate) O-methyltransferase
MSIWQRGTSAMEWAAARRNMVEGQVRPNRVNDAAIVELMLNLPREALLPAGRAALAYADVPVEIAPGRALLAPMVVARLVQEANPRAGERALALPGLAGYGAMLLAGLGLQVTALETAEHAGKARERLAALGTALGAALGTGVTVVAGALAAGHPAASPYHLILVEGALASVPSALCAQLAEGGRLLAVVGDSAPRRAVRIDRIGSSLTSRDLFDAAAPLLPDFAPAMEFSL